MNRIKKLAVALLVLALFLPGCKAQPAADTSGTIIAGEDTFAPPGEAKSEDTAAWEDVHEAGYDMYFRKYVVPYGSLKFYDETWTNPEDLGAELIYAFSLQKVFHVYRSVMDYGAVFGDEFIYLQVPESWFDEQYGCIYPQDMIESAATEYFGLDAAFLRTIKEYIPAKNGYAPQPEDPPPPQTERMPTITGVRRNGSRAEITFTLSPCDATGKLTEGDVQTRVMVVEDKEETFRYVSVEIK